MNPNDAYYYSNRGDSKKQLGRYEEAIKDYDKAIELNPNDAYYYSNRGDSKKQLGRYEEAIKDYDKAIELDHNTAYYYNDRGNAKLELGRCVEAIEDYDKCIELDPNYNDAYHNRDIARKHLYGTSSECFITTAVCLSLGKNDDCDELMEFRRYRDNILINDYDGLQLIKEYYNIAPKIVESINKNNNSKNIYKNIYKDFISVIYEDLLAKNYKKAKNMYIDMVRELQNKYLI